MSTSGQPLMLRGGEIARVDVEDFPRLWLFGWALNAGGYAIRYVAGGKRSLRRLLYLHREVMRAPPGVIVDHINGDRLDCRKGNLRLCTHAENIRNQRHHDGGTSRFRGVHRPTGRRRWTAQIKVNYRDISLGSFDDEVSAARAYDAAAQKYFGSFARLNFPTAEAIA